MSFLHSQVSKPTSQPRPSKTIVRCQHTAIVILVHRKELGLYYTLTRICLVESRSRKVTVESARV
jgi:hypothetical protein